VSTAHRSPETAHRVWQELMRVERIGIVGHTYPDGDAISSMLALAQLLDMQEKTVQLFSRHPVPEYLRFLPGLDRIDVTASMSHALDALVFIECTDPERTGIAGLQQTRHWINIDHHACNRLFAHINWVDPAAPCVGAMIYQLATVGGLQPPTTFYTYIYVSLMTDTGNFQYNLHPRVFALAYDLVRRGVPAEWIHREVYGRYPVRKWRLLARVLDTLEQSEDGRIAWITATADMLRELGAQYEDLDGFVDYPLRTRDVEVAIFFKEVAPNRFRVSLRCHEPWNLLPLAQQFGGGGHRKAVAFPMTGTLADVKARVLESVRAYLHNADVYVSDYPELAYSR